MRRVPAPLVVVLVVVAFLLPSLLAMAAVPSGGAPQPAPRRSLPEAADVSICAWVVDTQNNRAVEGASVSLLGRFGGTWQTLNSAASDATGHVLLTYTGETPERFALVKTNPPGYASVSASGSGWTVVSPDRVESPDGALGCATFVVVAVAPTPTRTATPRPTATAGNTPTRTPTPPVSTLYTLCGWVVTPSGTPLVGWPVRLDWWNGTSWVRPVASGVSDGSGRFCLTTDTHGGPPQFSLVQQPVLPGWTAVGARPLIAGGTVSDDYTVFTFGVGAPGTYNVVEFVRGQNTPTPTPAPPLSKVVGYVYEDLPVPVPIAGVPVRLYAVDGGMTPLGSTFTNAFGYFEFEGAYPPGTLAVIEEDLPGYYSTRSLGDERWVPTTANRVDSDGKVPIWGCLYFYDLQEPTPTPTDTPEPTSTPTDTPTSPPPTDTPTATPSSTATPVATLEPTSTAQPATPTPTETPEVLAPTATPTGTPEVPVPTATPTGTPGGPVPTATPTGTPEGPVPTATPTGTPEGPVPTATPTWTPEGPIPSATPTRTPEGPIPTATPTRTPEGPVPTATPTAPPPQPTVPPVLPTPQPSPLGTPARLPTTGDSGVGGGSWIWLVVVAVACALAVASHAGRRAVRR